MPEITSSLRAWSWAFLLVYMAVMVGCGAIAMRRVRSGDDFATARGGYGAVFLSFAVVATTASGATFLGLPGIVYSAGLSGLWYALVYPLGVYAGILLCFRVVKRAGHVFGNRSVPEYLGDRYQSDFLRILVALFSLLLLFYLAAQLLAGAVMFQQMMGIPEFWALVITSGVVLGYIGIGGAHADILTDGLQGALMLLLACGVIAMFFAGYGVEGGLSEVLARVKALNPRNVEILRTDQPIVSTWWAVFAIWFAHLPLGMLPHIGNKLWALKDDASSRTFLSLTFVCGVILPGIALGGVLARAVLGDMLLSGELDPNFAIPALFIELLPSWLAALLGAGVLAAVMSTADGIAVSASQIFANDIYRRSIAPRWHADRSEAYVEQLTLRISRVATALVLAASLVMAWEFQNTNVALLVWTGVGGMMAALAGPFMLGVVWRGLTKHAAVLGFLAGATTFIVLKSGAIETGGGAIGWLAAQAPNPFACATVGGLTSIATCIVVSAVTPRLPDEHLEKVFGSDADRRMAIAADRTPASPNAPQPPAPGRS